MATRPTAPVTVSEHATLLWAVARALTPDEGAARAAVLDVLAVAARGVPRADPEGWLLVVLARVTAPPAAAVVPLDDCSGTGTVGELDDLAAPERDVAVLCLLGGFEVARAARVLGRGRAAVGRRRAVAARVRLPRLPELAPPPVDLLEDRGGPPPRVRGPRRLRPAALVAAAAVVVVGVAAVTSVDRTGNVDPGAQDAPLRAAVAGALGQAALARSAADREVATRAGFPDSGDLVLDQHLARCAAAIDDTGAARRYPPTAQWSGRRTDLATAGVVSTVNDAFVCVTDPVRVWVSATRGVAAGGVQVLAAGPDHFALRNPDRDDVEVRVVRGGSGLAVASTNAALVVVPFRYDTTPADLRLTVTRDGRSTFDGPLPDPGFTAVRRADGPPGGPFEHRQDLPGPGDTLLARCLADHPSVPEPAVWRTVAQLPLDEPAQTLELVAAPGSVALCTGPREPSARTTMVVVPVADPPPARSLTPVALPGVDPVVPGVRTLVLEVDPTATRLEVSGSPVPVRCVVAAGRGACVSGVHGTGEVGVTGTATAYGPDGTVVAGPAELP